MEGQTIIKFKKGNSFSDFLTLSIWLKSEEGCTLNLKFVVNEDTLIRGNLMQVYYIFSILCSLLFQVDREYKVLDPI